MTREIKNRVAHTPKATPGAAGSATGTGGAKLGSGTAVPQQKSGGCC